VVHQMEAETAEETPVSVTQTASTAAVSPSEAL